MSDNSGCEDTSRPLEETVDQLESLSPTLKKTMDVLLRDDGCRDYLVDRILRNSKCRAYVAERLGKKVQGKTYVNLSLKEIVYIDLRREETAEIVRKAYSTLFRRYGERQSRFANYLNIARSSLQYALIRMGLLKEHPKTESDRQKRQKGNGAPK